MQGRVVVLDVVGRHRPTLGPGQLRGEALLQRAQARGKIGVVFLTTTLLFIDDVFLDDFIVC